MVEYNDQLSTILKSVSDSTRRKVLTLLCQQGACRVTDLAGHFEMSLNAVSKHIKVLETAGLVHRKALGRIHMIEADVAQLAIVEQWLYQMQSIWTMRLDALNKLFGEDQNE